MRELPPSALIPFDSTSGRRGAKLALVGEAFGEQEERVGLPFIGYSGQELTRMLQEAGLSRSDCFITNVFPFRPGKNNNDILQLCGPKAQVGKEYPHAPLASGKYILNEYLPCLERLREELIQTKPNLVVALGGTAMWALLGTTGISRARGVVQESTLVPGIKVIPTFHPASVLRNWANRPILVADLMKAHLEQEFPEIRRVARRLLINPHMDELWNWWDRAQHAPLLSADIETKAGQITMIGFAASPQEGVVVPFWTRSGSYWESKEHELWAWKFVSRVLASPVPKLWQNGLYDLQYLSRMGFYCNNCLHDTMLLHHSIYPELPKGLGFLGSIYCNESAWKDMRTKKELREEKKDA